MVYITSLLEVTEAYTTPQFLVRYLIEFPELQYVQDVDVLRFGTPEEAQESLATLQAKYGMRKLEVVMLGATKGAEGHE